MNCDLILGILIGMNIILFIFSGLGFVMFMYIKHLLLNKNSNNKKIYDLYSGHYKSAY